MEDKMNLNKVKQWVKSKWLEQTNESILLRCKALEEKCNDLDKQNEEKRISLILITTLLIMSLIGNAIQFFY
jgi:hypothetical protein